MREKIFLVLYLNMDVDNISSVKASTKMSKAKNQILEDYSSGANGTVDIFVTVVPTKGETHLEKIS